ncbi:MAG: S41 family peptidase [Erythrobacter sp.]|nr:S41 family peptidase [Erythrobacter sp.]
MAFSKAIMGLAGLLIALPGLAQAQDAATQEVQQTAPFDAVAAWNEFETLLRGAYAYIERDDLDVDAQLDRSQALAEQAENAEDFRRVIQQTALTFMDPHLIVGPFTDDDYAIIMTAADMDVAFVDGRAVVGDVRRVSPAFDAGIRSGDEMLAIDGSAPIDAAQLPFGEVLPDPTAAQLDYGVTLAANGKRGSGRVLKVRKGTGAVREVELVSTRTYARSLSDRSPIAVEFVGAEGDVAVIRILNSLGNNDTITAFDAAMVLAAEARAVILDMRETPSGGNTEVARSIIGHFTTQVRPYQMHVIPVYEREFSVPRQFVEYVHPREPYFGGPVYVLHGRWTGSMGEGIVIGMDSATDAVTVGSNMGDLLGGLWNRDLPSSGARVDLAGEALFHVDGTPREDYVAQVPLTPVDTAPDGTDPGIAMVLGLLGDTE